MKRRHLSLFGLSALLAGASTAHATIILSDSFAITAGGADYSTGQIASQSATVGTTGYTGAWTSGTSINNVTTGGLTHSAMTGTALEGRVRAHSGSGNQSRTLYRTIDYTTTPLVTGTYYFSALFSKSGATTADMLVGLGSDPGGSFGHQQNATNFTTFGIRAGGLSFKNTEIVTAASFEIDKTYIGVMEITYSTTGDDSLTASFYNEAGGLAGSQGFTGLDLDANMSHIAMGIATTYNNNVFVDEIRYGTALSDVFTPVPEPSAFALIGLGALALLRRRR